MNKKTKQVLLIVATLIAVLLAAASIYRLINPNIGFTHYEPTYLPKGVSIKSKRLWVTKYDDDMPYRTQQRFRDDNWIYAITEYKAYKPIPTASQNYDPYSKKATCSFFESSRKMRYRMCHSIDFKTIGMHEVQFIKAGTYINAKIPISSDTPISVSEISKFVDSFEAKSADGFPKLTFNRPGL